MNGERARVEWVVVAAIARDLARTRDEELQAIASTRSALERPLDACTGSLVVTCFGPVNAGQERPILLQIGPCITIGAIECGATLELDSDREVGANAVAEDRVADRAIASNQHARGSASRDLVACRRREAADEVVERIENEHTMSAISTVYARRQ